MYPDIISCKLSEKNVNFPEVFSFILISFFKLFYLSWTWISNILVFTNNPASILQCFDYLDLIYHMVYRYIK